MLEEITKYMIDKWRDAIKAHCLYGTENFCDGKPAKRGGMRKTTCFFYDKITKKCTQPEMAECKKNIKFYLEGERKHYGKRN